jgi:hypothetical protein
MYSVNYSTCYSLNVCCIHVVQSCVVRLFLVRYVTNLRCTECSAWYQNAQLPPLVLLVNVLCLTALFWSLFILRSHYCTIAPGSNGG